MDAKWKRCYIREAHHNKYVFSVAYKGDKVSWANVPMPNKGDPMPNSSSKRFKCKFIKRIFKATSKFINIP